MASTSFSIYHASYSEETRHNYGSENTSLKKIAIEHSAVCLSMNVCLGVGVTVLCL